MSYSRIGQTNPNNSLAAAMRHNSGGRLSSHRKLKDDSSLTIDDIDRIRKSAYQRVNESEGGAGIGGLKNRLSPTDLILEISRLSPSERSSNLIHSRITEYFHKLGRSSLNKWQINAVVRQVMATRVSVTHEDIHNLEEHIRRKETKLPGSKLSLKLRGNSNDSGTNNSNYRHIEMKTTKNTNLPSILKQ